VRTSLGFDAVFRVGLDLGEIERLPVVREWKSSRRKTESSASAAEIARMIKKMDAATVKRLIIRLPLSYYKTEDKGDSSFSQSQSKGAFQETSFSDIFPITVPRLYKNHLLN
jgi:hypothetical protein